MLSSFATTETNEQLKDDEKKGKHPGDGTQEPMKKTARDRDPRTREQTARDRDPRTRGEEREVQGESVEIRHAELVHKERWNTQTKSPAAASVREASKSEAHVGSCSVSYEECSGTTRCPVTRPLMEETVRSTLSSPSQPRESVFHAQIQCIDRVVDIPAPVVDVEAHPGVADGKERALEYADERKWTAKETDLSHDASNT